MVALWTLGHGRLDEGGLLDQLETAQVRRLVDVRRFPGSRTNHAVSRDLLPRWLPEAGVEYVWAPDLGGRRTLDADEPVVDTWWRCHRRVIADVAVLGRGAAVTHLMPGGRTTTHPPSPGARRLPDGNVVWDGPAD